MARQAGISLKDASTKAVKRGDPVEGGSVGEKSKKARPTFETLQTTNNARGGNYQTGKPVTPREYIEDFHQRGYYAPKTGETRVLDDVESYGNEPMVGQLKKAQQSTK